MLILFCRNKKFFMVHSNTKNSVSQKNRLNDDALEFSKTHFFGNRIQRTPIQNILQQK
jgi:hypothetical protein